MTRRLTVLATGLVGTALTLGLLIGPPWLLTTFVGTPVPSSWPDLDTLRTIATVGVTDTFVVTTLAVVVWIAWIQLAIAIVLETIAALRRRPSVRLPLLAGTQPLAARLVAATLLFVTAIQPRPVALAAPLEFAVATAASTVIDDDQAEVQQSPPTQTATHTPTQSIVAGERDSWWSLAETHLGDGLRWREIRDLNTGRTLTDGSSIPTDTDQLQPGWPLLVPTTGAGDQPVTDASPPVDDTGTPEEQATDEWEVEQGDHFWHIATTTLEHAWDRPPTNDEVVPYWRQLIDLNHDQLIPPGDPDLIHPGQRFELPSIPEDPQAPTASTDAGNPDPDPDPDPAPNREVQDPDPGPTVDVLPQPPDHLDNNRPHDRTTEQPPASAAGPPAASERRDTTSLASDLDGPTDRRDAHEATPLGVSSGATPGAIAAAMAAAGVVALLHRRRRTLLHQRPPGLRLPTPAPPVERHLATLAHTVPTDLVLEDLTTLLATIPADLDPPLVIIHDHGPVSLIVAGNDADPPGPWKQDPGQPDEPVRWTARIGDRGPCRSIGLPLLVTLGHTGTSTILANLGAIRALPIQGQPDQVRTRLRAMTLELATSRTAGPLEVTVCDDHELTDLDQVRTGTDPTQAIATTLADAQEGIIDDDRLPRAVVCHTPTDIELPAATGRFCALLSPGDITAQAWGLRVEGDRGWLHIPNAGDQPITLPDLDPTLIAQQLHDLTGDDALTPAPDEPASGPDHPTPAAVSVTPIQPRYCEVGVLGPVTVTRNGIDLDGLTPIARQLLTYLATHRDGVSLERLDAAIWPDRPPSRGGQRARTALTRLRSTLGDGPDGEPLLPRRDHADQPVQLTAHVGTDLDRALELLTNARHHKDPTDTMTDQLAALELIRGSPFQDVTVSWSVDIEQRAIAQLQDTAVAVATALSNNNESDRAVWAIQQGLMLCDPAEHLYLAWARIEQARGRADRIPQLWRRLRRLYTDDADEIAGVMTTPTTETEHAFTKLMSET